MKANGALLHGEAVIIGVVISSALAHLKGWLSQADFNRILALIHRLGIPVNLQYLCPELMKNALIERTHHRNGQQNVPLPQGLGHCAFANDLNESDLATVCQFLLQET
jgi:3-dehydroquinate synthase